MTDPIWIPCEGSDHPPTSLGTCRMCGMIVESVQDHLATSSGLDIPRMAIVCRLLPHDRRDILAELERGDYD